MNRFVALALLAALMIYWAALLSVGAQSSWCAGGGGCSGVGPRPPWCDGITCQGWRQDEEIKQLRDRIRNLEQQKSRR